MFGNCQTVKVCYTSLKSWCTGYQQITQHVRPINCEEYDFGQGQDSSLNTAAVAGQVVATSVAWEYLWVPVNDQNPACFIY